MSNPHILIIGSGSAGKRHARNLRQLDCWISAFDPREDRLNEIEKEGPLAGRYTLLDKALDAAEYDGFVIASPPSYHVDQVLQVLARQRKWVLCEKPLSLDAKQAQRLEGCADRVLLGYTYRWWPPVQSFRKRLRASEVGPVRSLRFVMSAHLADWHPWERYQEFFMSRRELGGGALLDESHFIDLMVWFLGAPNKVYAHVDKISRLEIDSDDNVDILVSYASGMRVNLHLDLIGRPHQRTITAVGEDGTLVYSYEENAVKVCHEGSARWQVEQFGCDRNDMFMGVAQEFLSLIRGETKAYTCGVQDGIYTLQIVDACRASAQTGQAVIFEA
ncbi:MAG: Gfo/Idh/MocA family oxidoreductase [Verrucomicrobiota bacterium]